MTKVENLRLKVSIEDRRVHGIVRDCAAIRATAKHDLNANYLAGWSRGQFEMARLILSSLRPPRRGGR